MKTTKFKPSEVGPVPVDWEVKRLGEVGEPLMCKRVLKCQTTDSGDIPFYKIGTFGKIADTYISRPLFELFRKQYSYPKKGDILLSAAGTIGRTVVFDGEDAYFQDSNIVWVDNDESIVRNDYLHWYYKVINWQTEDGGIVSRLYNNNLRNSCIAIPPLPEQKAIAEALSDVDALLAAMTTLIEKKRAIKQGAMQQLLTGKKRLAGFTGKWVEKRLGDVGEFVGGGTPSTAISSYWGGDIDWYTPAEIGYAKYVNSSNRRITNEGLRNSAARVLPAGAILLTTRASIGLRAILKHEAATNQGFQSLIVNEESDSEFMYYFLSTVVEEMESRASGSTFLEISSSKLKEIPIVVPQTVAEQKAIASVLSDMDAEIAALEATRAKYESIKQGMMQELLTGKTRLV